MLSSTISLAKAHNAHLRGCAFHRSFRPLTTKAPQQNAAAKPPRSSVFMFAGQASQMPGMGKDLAAEWKVARDVFQEADDTLRMNLLKRMFDGAPLDLRPTAIAQPAIVAHGIAVLQILRKELGVDPIKLSACVLGHSVGEITGFTAAEGLTLESALKLAHQRGIYMQAAVPANARTGMASLLPITLTEATALCLEATKAGSDGDVAAAPSSSLVLDIACINTPRSIVVSGDEQALERANKLIESNFLGRKIKSVPLDVSAPFHSRYMAPANAGLLKYMKTLKMKLATVPLVSGLGSNKLVRLPEQFIDQFVALTAAPVNFVGCIEQANNLLHTQMEQVPSPIWIEVSTKPTLSSFVSQVLTNPKVISLGTADDIRKLLNDKESVQHLIRTATPIQPEKKSKKL